jgi:hypothetical protein
MPKNVKGGAENAATLTFPGTLLFNAPGFLLSGGGCSKPGEILMEMIG